MKVVSYDLAGNITGIHGCPDHDAVHQLWYDLPWVLYPMDQNISAESHMVVHGQLIAKPIDPAAELHKSWKDLRRARDTALVRSDWTQANDSPLPSDLKAQWAAYRQQLRDLPAHTADPLQTSWPTPPTNS